MALWKVNQGVERSGYCDYFKMSWRRLWGGALGVMAVNCSIAVPVAAFDIFLYRGETETNIKGALVRVQTGVLHRQHPRRHAGLVVVRMPTELRDSTLRLKTLSTQLTTSRVVSQTRSRSSTQRESDFLPSLVRQAPAPSGCTHLEILSSEERHKTLHI